jgi:putative addiction module CopG family antidote
VVTSFVAAVPAEILVFGLNHEIPKRFGVEKSRWISADHDALESVNLLSGIRTMTMHLNLPPDVESYIAGQIKEGVYRSADDAVVDAVRRARQADEERHERLLKALEKGRQGEGIPYSRELMEKIADRALANLASGKHLDIDPDVLP